MDYRERKYYIMNIHSNYENKIKELRANIPSLSFHKPYNHFTFKNKSFKSLFKQSICGIVYDADCIPTKDILMRNDKIYIQQIASVRKEESDKFEALFKSTGDDYLKEVDKYYFGQ